MVVQNEGAVSCGKVGALCPEFTTTQGAIIIPRATVANQYYLFLNNNWCGGDNVLYYTIVDMNLNFGLGDVLFNPTPFYKSNTNISEKLSVIKHCNGKDYWLISSEVYFYGDSIDLDPIKYSGQRMKNVNLLSFYISELGINNFPVKSKTFVKTNLCESFSPCASGQLKISPNGKIAAFGHFEDLYLFRFDNSNGKFLNIKTIPYQSSFAPPDFCDYINYGLEFFDNDKLMFNNMFVNLSNYSTAYEWF